jgi:hypothetical protein
MASTMLTPELVGIKVGLFEEGAVLGLGALLAWGRGEHGDIEHLAGVEGVAFGQDKLDDQEAAGGDMARWQLARMVRHCSSLQSWMTWDIM